MVPYFYRPRFTVHLRVGGPSSLPSSCFTSWRTQSLTPSTRGWMPTTWLLTTSRSTVLPRWGVGLTVPTVGSIPTCPPPATSNSAWSRRKVLSPRPELLPSQRRRKCHRRSSRSKSWWQTELSRECKSRLHPSTFCDKSYANIQLIKMIGNYKYLSISSSSFVQ